MKAGSLVSILLMCIVVPCLAQQWPDPKALVIPEADGYVEIPKAAVLPNPSFKYRVIFDGTRAANKPNALLPAINAAGAILNELAAGKVPQASAKLAVVFHGDAVDGILDDVHYKAKFGVANPNLGVISSLNKRGVELFVCGQYLAAEHIDPRSLAPGISIASDAWLVLITYQNKGYALMSF